jgi:hypothetical protein
VVLGAGRAAEALRPQPLERAALADPTVKLMEVCRA